jgi:hypothetical protein
LEGLGGRNGAALFEAVQGEPLTPSCDWIGGVDLIALSGDRPISPRDWAPEVSVAP